MSKDKNVYPKGWDAKRVKAVIDHYDNQTEEEAVREFEASLSDPSQTLMSVPTELVPTIAALISSAANKSNAPLLPLAGGEFKNQKQLLGPLATTKGKNVRRVCKGTAKRAAA